MTAQVQDAGTCGHAPERYGCGVRKVRQVTRTEEWLDFLRFNGAERAGAARGLTGFGEDSDLTNALVVLVRLPVRIAGYLRSGPYQQYLQARERMDHNLAEILLAGTERLTGEGYRALGYMEKVPGEEAYGEIRSADRYLLDSAAAAAGLGWIGRNGRLIVRDFGPVVRTALILTDAPAEASEPETESHCGACRVCAGNCPADALTGKSWMPGMPEETLIDRAACEAFIQGGVCEKCTGTCTFTQKYMRNAKWY